MNLNLRCRWLAILCAVLVPRTVATQDLNRLRLIVETDAGGDPDDEQSLVRFLLYVNDPPAPDGHGWRLTAIDTLPSSGDYCGNRTGPKTVSRAKA